MQSGGELRDGGSAIVGRGKRSGEARWESEASLDAHGF